MMNGRKITHDQIIIPAPSSSSALMTIYASETSHNHAWGKGKLAIQPFVQGGVVVYVEAALPKTLVYSPDFILKSSINGTLPP